MGVSGTRVVRAAASGLRTAQHQGRLRRLGSALATYYTRAGRVDRGCYLVGATLFASGLFHLGVQLVAGGSWDGPVSWRKPFDFGLAFGLTVATLTWVTNFVPLRERTRTVLLSVFTAACVVEVTVITTQAWRQVPSHFNVSTPLNAAFAYTAAGGGAVIIGSTIAMAVGAFGRNPAMPPSMRLAVRAGFVSFLVALAIGALMIGLGVNATRTISQAAAYTVATAFKSGHAATMHGILILPALAWLTSFTNWSEARRLRVVSLGCVAYLLAAGVVVVDTFTSVDPLAPLNAPVVNTILTVGGIVGLLTAGIGTLRQLSRQPLDAGLERE